MVVQLQERSVDDDCVTETPEGDVVVAEETRVLGIEEAEYFEESSRNDGVAKKRGARVQPRIDVGDPYRESKALGIECADDAVQNRHPS